MMDTLAQFHFLRPWGLLLVLAGVLLYPLWHWLKARQGALSQVIAPHLLPHLLLPANVSQKFRPIHGFSALLIIAGLAISGPTCDKVLPPFADDQTLVTVVIDLSPSMAGSQKNSTLALAQDRIQALAQSQPGWYIGLIAYARSAHMVMPNTRDTELLKLYLNSLVAGMIPGTGRNLSMAVATAVQSQSDKSKPQTVIVVSDNLAASSLDQAQAPLPKNVNVLMLAPANALSNKAARPILDSLTAEARAFSTREGDVRWLERHVQSHFSRHQSLDNDLKWRDIGYWLIWPALLLSLLSIRKGWRLQWCLIPFVLILTPVSPVNAGSLSDAFFTPDQQGRLAFEAQRYAAAAQQFQNPYLRSLSAYRAFDYTTAAAGFRQLNTAEAWFYLGNSYAKQMEFPKAKVAYEKALKKQPQLNQAKANLALVTRLSKELDQERENAPSMEADELRFDAESDQGVAAEIQSQPHVTDDIWLQNISTSATDFLRRKFAIEQRNEEGAQP